MILYLVMVLIIHKNGLYFYHVSVDLATTTKSAQIITSWLSLFYVHKTEVPTHITSGANLKKSEA